MDSKENVENDPTTRTTPAPKTPKARSTAKTSRSAASLFSPSPYSMSDMKKPDPFPDNWEEAMGSGGASSSSRRTSRGRESQDSYGYGGGMSQVRLDWDE